MLLPTTLVAVLAISRNWSMPRMSKMPASGRLNIGNVAATTTTEARATPAIPLLVTMSVSKMSNCCVKLNSTL
ncbi:hypothetical protein D3C84_1203360 [compost metagenome]